MVDFNIVMLKRYLVYSKYMFVQNIINNFNIHLVRGRSVKETKLMNS